MYRDELKTKNIDRSQTAVLMNITGSFFKNLMAFMGFTDGLYAFYEEPGGGYIFAGGFLGSVGDENIATKNDMLHKAVKELQFKYY